MSLVKRDEKKQALIKKAQDLYVRHKRPAVVLEEDEYIDGLSNVIKRQFFPTLCSSEDTGPDRNDLHTTASIKGAGDETTHGASTSQLSLSEYQAKYTSEDNASFLDLLDKQNLMRREKYVWHYTGNKLYSENVEREGARIERRQQEKLTEKAIDWNDTQPPIQSWRVTPKNALMFSPDTQNVVDTRGSTQQSTIDVANTRLHEDSQLAVPRVRTFADQDSASDEEEIMVNGYGFVDEPDTPLRDASSPSSLTSMQQHKSRADTPNLFKIAQSSRRDLLHDSLLAKTRASTTPRPTVATGALKRTMATPRFKSSPVLSPAAHRLLAGNRTGLRARLRTPLRSSNLK